MHEDKGRGTYQIVVTEIPCRVQKARLIEQHRRPDSGKKLPLLADVSDESTEEVRLVLQPKSRTVDPALLMEELFELTDLEARLPLNMNVLMPGAGAAVMGLRRCCRNGWITARGAGPGSRHRLGKIDHRLEVLEGFLIVYLNLDQ